MRTYIPRPEIERRLLETLTSTQSVILLGPRGSGKTALLERLRSSLRASRPVALIQMEPIAASPEILCERFLQLSETALVPGSHRSAPFPRLLAALTKGRRQALLLLDDFTELRTLSYFPGVERPLENFLEALAKKQAPQAVLTSRFPAWVASCFQELSDATRSHFEVLRLPSIRPEELTALGMTDAELMVSATGGLPVHLSRLFERIEQGDDLPAALAAEMAGSGRLEAECRATLGQLLHRARGYGACKAVLHVLAAEEGLRLTDVARRLDRTPGSTRDYLRWLEEVDLIAVRDKRFFFVDPVLRLWLRLYGQGEIPSGSAIEAEVGRHLNGEFAAARPPAPPPVAPEIEVFPPYPNDDEFIEID